MGAAGIQFKALNRKKGLMVNGAEGLCKYPKISFGLQAVFHPIWYPFFNGVSNRLFTFLCIKLLYLVNIIFTLSAQITKTQFYA